MRAKMGCLNSEACYRSIVFIDPLCMAACVVLSHRHGCYISVMRRCGALVTRVDRRGVTTVFAPVFWVTSAGAGVFRWVRAAAEGLRAAAGWGVAGATGGCAAVASGAGDDGSVTAIGVCLSGLTASGWRSRMWSRARRYSPPLITFTM